MTKPGRASRPELAPPFIMAVTNYAGELNIILRPASFYHLSWELAAFGWIAKKQSTLTSPGSRRI
jgi:hypothetical protein